MSIFARDDSHPQAAVTHRNCLLSPFLRLPTEIRLLVYEFATVIAGYITPKQVTTHSNKYCWGAYKVIRPHDIPRHVTFRLPSESQLTVVQLERTCYSIAKDLETHNTFYRGNTFHFDNSLELERFLYSITEGKRNSMQHLAVEGFAGYCNGIFSNPLFSQRFVPLLQECRGLTSIDVILDLRGLRQSLYYSHHRGEHIVYLLDKAADQLQSGHYWPTSQLFDLRGANVFLRISNGQYIDLKNPDARIIHDAAQPVPDPYVGSNIFSTEILELPSFKVAYQKLNRALKLRQEMSHNGSRQDECFTSAHVTRLLSCPEIDLPGHLRGNGSSLIDQRGTISARTRSKDAVSVRRTHDNFGMLISRHEKYDRAEGRTLRWGFKIADLRRVGEEIEFFAVFDQGLHERPDSWEDLHVAFGQTFRGTKELEGFYNRLLCDHGGKTLTVHSLQEIPSPQEVIRASQGLIAKRWVGLQKSFARVLRDRKKAEAAEKQKQKVEED